MRRSLEILVGLNIIAALCVAIGLVMGCSLLDIGKVVVGCLGILGGFCAFGYAVYLLDPDKDGGM